MSGTRPFPAHMYRVPDPGDRRIAILTARVAELEDENAALKKRIEILEPPKPHTHQIPLDEPLTPGFFVKHGIVREIFSGSLTDDTRSHYFELADGCTVDIPLDAFARREGRRAANALAELEGKNA